ncbi:hypothetical protein [Acinetobacter sp. MD2(2019)]|uniref:hypothetical protein n=1 Tax=Acinetobacter sp. MD2(2019) TaxID=2605273 RepID=UPI002D1ED844|nr:hypothetical protein [Acinetobacter sp. MD2(2019)]MEB3753833.1 hypothetical protein [Acinetobacter sp. MD2(2019)]
MTYIYFAIKFWRECIIVLLAIILIACLLLLNATDSKLKSAETKCAAKIQAIEQAQQRALSNANAKANKVSQDYETLKSEQQTKTETITRTVQKIVERPVYINTCFDSDGVSAVNAAGNTS